MLIQALLLLTLLTPQQSESVTPVDHSDKPCVVTEVVKEGVRSDCNGWRPWKGESMFMPGRVSQSLKVGDVFYFVWKENRWVSEIKKILCIQTGTTQEEVRLSCNDPERSELLIPVNEWPSVWHGPELGFAYPLDANGAALPSLPTQADRDAYRLRQEKTRENQLKEMRRWRIQPLQYPTRGQ